MKIEINPRSLLNLEHIVEVLYKLHPCVLDDMVGLERDFGGILGFIDLSNPSLEEREFFINTPNNSPEIPDGLNLEGIEVNNILNKAKAQYASDYLADGTPVFKEILSEESKK